MASEDRRPRGSAFTQEEKDLLKEIVGRFTTILENKKTDAFSARQKKEAWGKLASVYNSYSFVTRRTPEQLKKAWENLKTIRKRQASALNQHRMATGGGPSIADLADDPLMDLATPYLLHTVASRYDSDAIALQGCSSAGHVNRSASASPLASFGLLTGTHILDEDLDDSNESQSPAPQSTLCAEWSFPISEDEREPTLSRSSSSQSRFSTNFGGGDEPLPSTSCAMDYSIPRNSGRMVSFSSSARKTSDGTTERNRTRFTPSASVVHSPSVGRAEDTAAVSRRRDRERFLSTSNAGVAGVSRPDQAGGSSTVNTVGSSGRSSGTGGETPIRGAKISGDGMISGTAKNRAAVCREEHTLRMAQLDTTAAQKDELHAIRLREASVSLDAATIRARVEKIREEAEIVRTEADVRFSVARARAEEARAIDAEEQLEFNRLQRSRGSRSATDGPSPL